MPPNHGQARLVDLARRELHRYTALATAADSPHDAAAGRAPSRLRLALLLADLAPPQGPQRLSLEAAAAAAACSPALAAGLRHRQPAADMRSLMV